MNESYIKYVKDKSPLRYLAGLLIRWWHYRTFQSLVKKSRKKGSKIGEGVVITKSISKAANHNLSIGDHSTINNSYLDLRNPITIGKNVIIGGGNMILTTSHDVNSPEFARKDYGIEIDDYVWITSNAIILPSCRKIGYGAVIGCGSVVVRDVEPMAIMSGNPAVKIKDRSRVHSEHSPEINLGGDFLLYKQARKE
jgi:maltose O-acetyltransferase